MSDSNIISVSRLQTTLSGVLGNPAWEPLRQVLDSYHLPNDVEIQRGMVGDGVVAVSYQFDDKQTQTPMKGVLRFAEDGSVYDGLQKLDRSLPSETTRFFIATTFGVEELTSPLGREASEKLTAIYNQKTVEWVEFAYKMLAVAEKEDEGWGGWDPDDFSEIVSRTSAAISIYTNSTLDGARKRLTLAEEMIFESAKTYSGARACVQLGWCRVSTRGCGKGYDGSYTDYIFQKYLEVYQSLSRTVRTEGSCKAEKDPDACHGKNCL